MKRVISVTSKNEEYEIVDAVAREEKLNISDLPNNLSHFNNDLKFIDKTVDDLLNYYKKSETYSRDEVRELLTARLTIKKVSELPTEDISSATIYFVPKHNELNERDYYDEYIWVDNQWELIGNTYIDLTDYYTKSETDRIVQSKVDSEITARKISESQIRGSIQTLAESINSNTEIINSEIDSRIASDMEFRGGISRLSENLSDEINRATNAENTLSSRCDTYDSHIYDVENPHNVTKSQIGLDNVKNVSTDDDVVEDSLNNVSSGAVYNALQNKVDKVSGKGLSDQNFTFAEKMKLAGLSNYDDTELNSKVTATESAITTLNGDSSVSGSVDKKIADAMSGITGFDFVIVSALPASGEKGIIYLTPQPTQGEQDNYDEYIWLDSAWEYLGKKSVTVDLTDYYTKAQVNALASVKQDKITVEDDTSALTDSDSFDETSAGTNPTTTKRRLLSSLWTYIQTKVANILSGYQTKLTFDSTPTSGSSNPVTSGGVYTAIEQNASDIATLKSSVSNIGKYGFSGIKTANITGGSTSAIQLATTVKLSAGKTYLLGLHIEQAVTDGACNFVITDATGTALPFWESTISCPIGKCRFAQSFPVKLAADTTLGIKVTPWQASAGNWFAWAEISWTQLS